MVTCAMGGKTRGSRALGRRRRGAGGPRGRPKEAGQGTKNKNHVNSIITYFCLTLNMSLMELFLGRPRGANRSKHQRQLQTFNLAAPLPGTLKTLS